MNKIKKIIHIADIHIRTYKMLDVYKEVFKTFFKETREICKDYEYGEVRIAIVGDLLHQKITISNEQVQIAGWFLKKCAEIAPVVIVAGNHDLLEDNQERMDSISPIINLMDNPNIQYLKERKCYPDRDVVWCNYSVFEHNQRPEIEEARETYGEDRKYIGLYHAPIIGSTTDKGYTLKGGANMEHFEGCDVVLLGDIHKRQEFNHKGIKAVFPSSLIQQNYGESIDKHGYLVWDVETLSYTEHDIATSYGFYQFSIESLDDVENGGLKLINKE
jgi:DNA repair exonuclease SbcCD nuclease subunit